MTGEYKSDPAPASGADAHGFAPGAHEVPGPDLTSLRPGAQRMSDYRKLGLWRDGTVLDDLRRWRDETPDRTAISARATGHDAGDHHVTYREYARHVERFAAALHALGVRPGQVVAVQLPNWWQVNVLALACARVGAVFAPVMMTIRSRELERILDRLRVGVLVTTDVWEGYEHAAAVAAMAPRLPALRHRAVLGARVAGDETDFARYFQDTPWETTHPMPLDEAEEDPDRVAYVMFTSGTSGEPKGILHSFNTIHSSLVFNTAEAGFPGQDLCDSEDTFFTPHSLNHIVGLGANILLPLLVGGTSAMLDTWEPGNALAWMEETRTTLMGGAPVFISELLAASAESGRSLPTLRFVRCGAAPVPHRLSAEVRAGFGVPLHTGWGMTEIMMGTLTGPEDPEGWAAHSDGRPVPGIEIDLRAEGEIDSENPGRLHVRGAGLCLATLGRDSGELVVMEGQNGGWYDTGDYAVPDGRGGIHLAGRVSDRIGGVFMIPALDVEDTLRTHPAVRDIALVGYPDGTPGGELACAVVVRADGTPPPTLEDLRAHLIAEGMTEWYQPSRIETVPDLPRTATGKVRKELLRRWLRGEAQLEN
ncbi:AMP-binding protein [Streptomyces iconiensis]|uniref:AMP-binding protein n=1 Tax=Streptomyces iconiensis TaxID=1384038 RepID=A0ABT6ZQL4_9ACTN|nr:AMP-binding protein [Streptomyces iconiensis]MDJ1131309.1 AMP-binding protein [Streptomyces iconiensis]